MKISLKDYLKPKLSIQEIGQFKFYLGITVGIFSAISLYLFLYLLREALRLQTEQDLLVLNRKEVLFYNFFLASISGVFGQYVCNKIWFRQRRKLSNYKKDLIFTHGDFSMLNFLGWILKAIVVSFIYFISTSFHLALSIQNELFYIFPLLFISLFFQQWNEIKLNYRGWKWVFLSFVVIVVFSSTMMFLKPFYDDEKYNANYLKIRQAEYSFTKKELERAKKWGITFADDTLKALKTRMSYEKNILIESLRQGLNPYKAKKLILYKIFLHEFQYGKGAGTFTSYLNSSAYYEPIYFYLVLKLPPKKYEKEIILMLEILKEYEKILNAKKLSREEWQELSLDKKVWYRDLYAFNDWHLEWGLFDDNSKNPSDILSESYDEVIEGELTNNEAKKQLKKLIDRIKKTKHLEDFIYILDK